MLADPQAKAAVAAFHGEWLSTGVVRGVDKNKTMFPEFTDAIRADMQQEITTSSIRCSGPTARSRRCSRRRTRT